MTLRQRLTWEMVALVATLVAVVAAVALPTARRIVRVRQELLSERQELESRYRAGLGIRQLKARFAEARAKLDALPEALPRQNRDELALITAIEAIGRAHGQSGLATKLRLDQKGDRSAANLIHLPTQLEWQGSFPDLLAALRELERLPQPLVWQALHLSAAKGAAPAAGTLTLNGYSSWRP